MTSENAPSVWIPWCISTQHSPEVTLEQIRKDMIDMVIKPTIPAELLDENTKYLCQPHRPVRHRRPPG